MIVVRHAEKDPASDPSDPGVSLRDPGLSEAGRARAQALAQMLAHSGVSALYSTELRRARETLVPLAEARALELNVVPAADPARLVELLKNLPAGAVAVVAGHSNTVPAIVRALGGAVAGTVETQHGPALAEAEYGRIFVVTRLAHDAAAPAVATLELAYPER